jgi:hypothetical protein
MNKVINEQFDKLLLEIRESKSSIFSQDDVFNIIFKLQRDVHFIGNSQPNEPKVIVEPKIDINDLKDYIEENLYSVVNKLRTDEVIDFDSAEFHIDSNCISLSEISLNENNLENKLSSGINKIIDNYIAQ